jgi:7,8-dihydro-6-hydroxymethylpterin-pyrophosphokinase
MNFGDVVDFLMLWTYNCIIPTAIIYSTLGEYVAVVVAIATTYGTLRIYKRLKKLERIAKRVAARFSYMYE